MKRKICFWLSALLVFSATDRIAAALTDGLAGYWPFDDRQGTNVADLSGRGKTGVLRNVPTDGSEWVAGKLSGAIDFSGTNQMVVPAMPLPFLGMTFSAWIWADSPPGGNIANLGSLDSLWLVFEFGLAGPNLDFLSSSAGPLNSLQNWHHVGFVADGLTVAIWQDGQLTGVLPYYLPWLPDPLQLIIGPFHGRIDDAAFWLRPLSDDEIMDVYEAGLAGRPLIASTSEVVAWGDNSLGQTNVPRGLTNLLAIAAGAGQSLVLKRDGTVTAWGGPPGLTPIPPGLTDVVAIATAGYDSNNFSLALRRNGTVIPWGEPRYFGPPVPDPLHPPPDFTNDVLAVAAGFYSELVIRPNGLLEVYLWRPDAPVTNALSLAAGRYHALTLTRAGTVVAWGWNDYGQTTVPSGLSNVIGIAAGDYHSLALKADGTVVGWGNNSHGQLDIPAGLTNATAVAAGTFHSLALKRDGTLVAWGENSLGQTNVPAGLSNVVAISGGENYNLAMIGAGPPVLTGKPVQRSSYTGAPFLMLASAVGLPPLAYQWQFKGANLPGATNAFLLLPDLRPDQSGAYAVTLSNALGTVSATNTVLTAIHTTPIFDTQPADRAIYPGGNVTFQAAAEGTLPLSYEWLFNGAPISGATNSSLFLTAVQPKQAGQYAVLVRNPVGTVSSSTVNLLVEPVVAWGRGVESETNVPPGLTNISAVAAGSNYCLALQKDGRVIAWGDNSHGQTNAPPSLTNVTAISAGAYHCLALKDDGTVAAWGDNHFGQTNIPSGLQNVVAVAAGGSHSLALQANGRVTAWGDNSLGQTNAPIDLSNVVAIAAGGAHSLALRASGTVVAWGDNSDGQTSVPLGLDNVMAISAGLRHSLALRSDGLVLAWGSNAFQVVQVPPGLTNIAAISAGNDFNLALRADGLVVGWGRDDQGQTDVPTNLIDVVGVAAGAAHSLVLTSDGRLTLVEMPRARVAYTGNAVTLNAGVVGGGPLTYQWRRNGVNLVGATNRFLTLPVVQPGDAGDDTVVIDNAVSSLGRDLHLTVVNSAPVIIGQPADQMTYPGGGSATFQVAAEGSQPLVYQWFRDGIAISGATNNMLALSAVQLGQQGLYTVRISNQYGTNMSNNTRLSVGPVVEWGDYRDNSANSLTVPARVPVDLTNAVAIAAGYAHSLALTETGRVIAWGKETNLAGLNTAFGQTVVPANLTNVVAIAAGGFDSLAVQADGTVAAWGDNSTGQTQGPKGLDRVVAAASGYQNISLALQADGRVTSWGNAVAPPDLHKVVQLAAGASQSVALMDDGSVVVWPPILGAIPHDLTNMICIAAGQLHGLALRVDGRIVAWGSGPGTNVPPGLHDVVAIAAGAKSGLALKVDGTLTTWGDGPLLPVLTNILDIAAGPTHYLALVGPGALVRVSDLHLARLRWVSSGDATWVSQTKVTYNGTEALQSGSITAGQQSRLQTTVFGPGALSFWWKTSAEAGHAALSFSLNGGEQARLAGETDWVQRTLVLPAGFCRLEWDYAKGTAGGSGSDAGWLGGVQFSPQGTLPPLITGQPQGQPVLLGTNVTLRPDFLGVDPVTFQWQFNGTDLPGATNPTFTLPQMMLSEAGSYSVVLSNAFGQVTSDKATLSMIQVVGWGLNHVGQAQPQAALSKPVAIAGGAFFSAALWQDGTVSAWGGLTPEVRQVPTTVNDGRAVAIAAGAVHGLALKNDGRVVAWGVDSRGQTEVPSGLSNVVAIAAGYIFSLALTRDGTVVAWGDPAEGEIFVPSDLTNVVAITCGRYHALALKHDGTVVGWGLNGTHQLDAPPGLTNAVAIAAGYNHSLALRADGTVIGWGGNAQGELNIPPTLDQVVAIAAAETHSLALRADGTVVCWGNNFYGQSFPPTWLAHVVAIAAGSSHSLALLAEDGAPLPLGPPPRLLRAALDGSQFKVQVQSVIGRILALEFTDSLTDGNWQPLPLVLGDGELKWLVDPSAASASQRFYRVRQYQ